MEAGHSVVIIDNLANSRLEVLDRIERIVGARPDFKQLDLCDEPALDNFFRSDIGQGIDAVIHFAAYKNIGESVSNPLKYYANNLGSLINTIGRMSTSGIPALVYSSSCSVYGNPESIPVTESSPLQAAESPYASTKRIGEEIVADSVKSGGIKAISLRYFNPIGAHPSNEIGELPTEYMDNIMPALMSTARGTAQQFSVYGNDYETPDGSCVRDYIDVNDLANAHVKAVDRLTDEKVESVYEVYNLGTGVGVSVMEMISMTEKVTGLTLPFEVKPRREGDVEAVFADPKLANEKLEWKTERSLEDMIKTAWAWSGALLENAGNNE